MADVVPCHPGTAPGKLTGAGRPLPGGAGQALCAAVFFGRPLFAFSGKLLYNNLLYTIKEGGFAAAAVPGILREGPGGGPERNRTE